MEHVGLFGGSFDPPHLGHLIIAESLCDEFKLDEVIWMPAYEAPHKSGASASAVDREQMVRLAISDNRSFSLGRHELDRGGVSFTVDTVRALKRERGDVRISVLMGSDSLLELPTWRAPEAILEMAEIIAYPRGSSASGPGIHSSRVHLADAPLIGISSTMIRDRIRRGRSVRYLLPKPVAQYVDERRLYES